MVNIDALLNEWAYRCEKGYPDMDSPSDLRVLNTILQEQGISLPEFQEQVIVEEEEKSSEVSIKELIGLLQDAEKSDYLTADHKKFLKQFISSKPYQQGINSYLDAQNISTKTFDTGDAPKKLFRILQDNDDVKVYAEYIKNPTKLSEIPREGRLTDIVKEKTGFSDNTIKNLINLKGVEGGRGVGKAEVFLATIFDDVNMSAAKGDLDWGGKYLEVKGTDARLGKRERPYTDFENSPLGKLATEADKSDKNITTLVVNLSDEYDNEDRLREALKEFSKTAHPKGDHSFIDTVDLSNANAVKKALVKAYFTNYAAAEGVDEFIFVHTGGPKVFGKYRIFKVDEIPPLVDKGLLGSKSITTGDLDPSIASIK